MIGFFNGATDIQVTLINRNSSKSEIIDMPFNIVSQIDKDGMPAYVIKSDPQGMKWCDRYSAVRSLTCSRTEQQSSESPWSKPPWHSLREWLIARALYIKDERESLQQVQRINIAVGLSDVQYHNMRMFFLDILRVQGMHLDKLRLYIPTLHSVIKLRHDWDAENEVKRVLCGMLM